MAWTKKTADLEMRVRPISPHDSPSPTKQEDAAIEELGHKATLPRTLTSRPGIIGTISTVICPWPTALVIAPLNLTNGGTGGLLIGFVISSIFMTLVYYLIAEKIPLTPTASGQYHMVLRLAPKRYRRFLSYICGFTLCFTWESFLTAAAWQFGLAISAMITIWTGEYQVYYTFLPTAIMLMIACAVNLTWGKHMNVVESWVLVVHFAAFFLVVVILAMASGTYTLSASFTFESLTGWPRWVGFLLGVNYCTAVLGGLDCATHLAEDTEDSRTEIPKSLLISTTVNSFSCIVVAALVVLCAGDVNIFTGPLAISGHPLGTILQLFLDATRGNKSAACSVFALFSIIFAVCTVNTSTTSSRMLFSLIRDGRDPVFTKLMAKDLNEKGLPARCIIITTILPLVILWINFVSNVGFQAIVSQVTLALVGRQWGIAMDIIAMIFLVVVAVVSCLPYAPHPGATGFNYAPFMVVAVILIGIVLWFVSARKHYHPGQGM